MIGIQIQHNFSVNLFNFKHFARFCRLIPKNCHFSQDSRTSKILFLGNELFSLPPLEQILRIYPPSKVTVVVSSLNNLIGKYCKKNDLRLIDWKEFRSEPEVDFADFEVGVVAAFGHLIPDHVIQRCKLGILNVHGSILPRWRGASPVSYSLINGDKTTGISIMKIAPTRFDIGPLLLTRQIRIPPHIKEPELRKVLSQLGGEALHQVLSDLPTYLNKALPQNESEATLAPKVTPSMGEIQWESFTAVQIYNLYRGLYGTVKLTSTYLGKKVDLDGIGVLNPKKEDFEQDVLQNAKNSHKDSPILWIPLNESLAREPGEIVYSHSKDVLSVYCKGSWIFIRKIKIGTKWMTAGDFRNGFLSKRNILHKFITPSKPLVNTDLKSILNKL